MEALRQISSLNRFEQLRFARDVLRAEGEAVLSLVSRLGDEFCEAVELLLACRGTVVVTGMGKAGLIGQKLVATLASTGTRSQFLHPGEAVHGDLGRVGCDDSVLALSFSGETEELLRILPSFRQLRTPIVAMTGDPTSALARSASVVLSLGSLREACPWGLAPSTSTTAMLALGDALALLLSRLREFGPQDFARNHPGGNLGRKLARVEEVMRPMSECRVADDEQTVREVLVMASKPGRRSGAIMLCDTTGMLTGVFTDSDLARLLERRHEEALDRPIRDVMTRSPTTMCVGALMSTAVEVLVERKISELPVVDDQRKPVGLIDITDIVAYLPNPQTPPPDVLAALEDALPDAEPTPKIKTLPFPNPAIRQSRR